nr:reverse transcriptase domain-containing protein [Tanacetum cinerariifolium]
MSRRIDEWAIELEDHDIKFRGCNFVKGQILADILAETPLAESKEKESKETTNKKEEPKNMWKLYTYGASSYDGSGAEYEALLAGLRIAASMEVQDLNIFVDSQRDQNKKSNAFSKPDSMTLSRLAKEVLLEVLHEKSIAQKEVADIIKKEVNGRVEVTNRDIVKGMERRLGKTHQGWMDELPHVLWTHKTTSKSSNDETPFSLVYGSEAVVPIEISMETKRIKEFKVKTNEKRRREDLDILKEQKEMCFIREAYYKHELEGYYNKHVRPSTFKPGTYVL